MVGGIGNMDYEGIVNTVCTSVMEFYVRLAPVMPLTAHGDYTIMTYYAYYVACHLLKKINNYYLLTKVIKQQSSFVQFWTFSSR